MRFRVPEIFLGCFLTIAVFAVGMTIGGPNTNHPTQSVRHQGTPEEREKPKNPDAELTGSIWLTKDAAGFFTFWLVVVGIAQAFLFFVQLRFMRKGMNDAQITAEAARDAAAAGTRQAVIAEQQLVGTQRPWVKVDSIKPISDLVFEDGEAWLDVIITVSNRGNSPGLRVRVGAKIVASNQISLLDEQRTFAVIYRVDPVANEVRPEITSWPGDTINFPVRIYLNSVDMPRFKPLADSTPFPVSLLAIVGCLTYEFNFEAGYHQTGIIFALRKKTPYPGNNMYGPPPNGAIRFGETVSAADLAISIGFEGTGPVD